VRNNTVLKVRLLSIPPRDSATEPPKVTVADMARIAEGVHYDESAAELKQEDGQFRILCQEGVSEILAGQTLNFEALFENGTVGQKKNLSRIDWRVKETETGTAPEEVSLSDKGQLTTRKKISRVINLTVTAESPVFHTSAEYSVTVIPAVSGVKVSPNRLIMYLAEGSEATVQASFEGKAGDFLLSAQKGRHRHSADTAFAADPGTRCKRRVPRGGDLQFCRRRCVLYHDALHGVETNETP